MSTNPESFDAALADLCEFVDFNRQCFGPPVVMRCAVASELEGVARRLKAAHKREVEDAERRGHHAATKACCETIKKAGPFYDAESVGNAAKLREAVKAVVDVGYPHNFQREAPHIRGYCYDITRAIGKCFAALAAPARNCDVGTAEEQKERFSKFCTEHTDPMDIDGRLCDKKCPLYKNHPNCRFAWAQMPYDSEASDMRGDQT